MLRSRRGPWPGGGGANDLVQLARRGLTLDDAPFDHLGAALGWSGELVIEALRLGLSHGHILHLGLVLNDRQAPPQDRWGQNLLDASHSGLPLVHRPYEALGAMLGVPEQQVQTQLGQWQRQGRLLRIAAVLPHLP